jgi:hypothetical protein
MNVCDTNSFYGLAPAGSTTPYSQRTVIPTAGLAFNNDLEDWEEGDIQAISLICTVCEKIAHNATQDISMSNVLWNTLQALYSKESALSTVAKLHLYFNFKITDGKSMNTQLNCFQELCVSITLELAISNGIHLYHMLIALLESWSAFWQVMLTSIEITTTQPKEIWQKILGEEAS